MRSPRSWGTDHFDPIPDEPDVVLHARDDHAREPRERRRTPVGTMRAAVAPCRRQAADVPLGAVVVRRHRWVVQEGEQLVAVLVQPTGWANDPRLSRAGNRVARRLASVLEGLAQMETWLHHQGRAGLTPGDR